MIELIAFGLFLVAGSWAAALVVRKIPLLLQVPAELIQQSFVTRPSRVKQVLEPALAFIQERRYRAVYRAVAVRALHTLRVWLLRLERVIYRWLETLEAREQELTRSQGRYWGELTHWKDESRLNGVELPQTVIEPEPPPMVASKEGTLKKIAANSRKSVQADQS